ncbi:MAG: response regulator transcription factor [Anaerolineales bacterium]|nr:response regulator transcription factor [Anaerolineales bacterium]
MDKIRVLVVDDQNVVREGFVAILSFQSDIEVVGQAEDGIQALKLVKTTQPDVILLDLVMPRQDGMTTIPMIKEIAPEAHILVLTSFAEGERVFQAIKTGATGYLLKDATREQLLQAIRDVAHGQASLHPSIALKVIREINHPEKLLYTADPLTPRELETLRLIARGLTNQEIGMELHVHERTIAKKVSSILAKLQLANRTQAALYALRKGLSDEPLDE